MTIGSEFSDGGTGFRNRLLPGQVVVQETGEGVFVYNGTPTAGNLIVAIAAASGTDPYGNDYLAGIGVYSGELNYINQNVVSGIPELLFNPDSSTYVSGIIAALENAPFSGPETRVTSPYVSGSASQPYAMLSLTGHNPDDGRAAHIAVRGGLYNPGLTPQQLYSDDIGAELVNYCLNTQTNNTTTLAIDDELFFEADANSVYWVNFYLMLETASATCDLKTDWNVPASTTGLKMCLGATDTAAAFTSRTNTAMRVAAHQHGTDVVYQLGTGSAANFIWEKGIVKTGATAGEVNIRWAQNVLDGANPITREQFCYMTVKKIG